MRLRRAAVAGTWYPATAERLNGALATHLHNAGAQGAAAPCANSELIALVAPHAGLMYSGPVAAHAYRLLEGRTFDTIIVVGPSHYVTFEGASIWRAGAFETPLGNLRIDEDMASAIIDGCPIVSDLPAAHAREHSIEMQLPFLASLAPTARIVPLVMGHQTRDTAFALADCLAAVASQKNALLIASSDLSHFFEAAIAASLDHQVAEHVETLDADGLMARLERRPEHACGGGPMVSVLRAATALGGATSRVLQYADSGDVSGDKSSVVGYLAAAIWR
ncbi:MAG: AmmeMemoRadiSam system protein B [Acidobacteria bacterium]|nr:AmmeMemoRadiSam system protein B [Acidobacteriota bacterium]